MNTAALQQFFECCLGDWDIERTYHYLSRREVERSHTNFSVRPLTPELREQVLRDNAYELGSESAAIATGFQLAFSTVSERGEKVAQSLNALFVPRAAGARLSGDYLRDRAYEEDRPIVSRFEFDPAARELLMTTPYTRVVAVDSITLVNPELRIRKIVTYARPPGEADPLEKVVLIGFGVEQKVSAPEDSTS